MRATSLEPRPSENAQPMLKLVRCSKRPPWPKSDQLCLKSAETGPTLIEIGPRSNSHAELGPNVAESKQILVDDGRCRTKIGRHQPGFGRFRAKVAGVGRSCSIFWRMWTEFGQARPLPAPLWQNATSTKLGRICRIRADLHSEQLRRRRSHRLLEQHRVKNSVVRVHVE